MFIKLSEQASECRLYVDHRATEAGLQTDPKLRQVYLHNASTLAESGAQLRVLRAARVPFGGRRKEQGSGVAELELVGRPVEPGWEWAPAVPVL
jgi:hypothetical protein